MQRVEAVDPAATSGTVTQSDVRSPTAAVVPGGSTVVAPQSSGGKCGCGCTSGADPQREPILGGSNYIYALGRIVPRFPSLAVEKEFAQATGRAGTAGLTDRQSLAALLSQRPNRYLARQLCWVFLVEGLETYVLRPRDPSDIDLLVEAARAEPQATDLDAVIGMRGPIAPPEMCNGLMVPIVAFDQVYSFDVNTLIGAIPRPEEIEKERFKPAAEEVFGRIMQMADNAGATDEHRALNYLALRYPAIYAKAADEFARDFSMTAVDVRGSSLGVTRRIVDVIFSFTGRQTDFTEKFFVRVDVTEMFPFLVTKLSPYFDR
jgi:PatG C-terminal